jgi:hypothetical protein
MGTAEEESAPPKGMGTASGQQKAATERAGHRRKQKAGPIGPTFNAVGVYRVRVSRAG